MMSTQYYFLAEATDYPPQYKYALYCLATNQKYIMHLFLGDQNVHEMKRQYFECTYNLGGLCLSQIPQELLDYVKIAQVTATEHDFSSRDAPRTRH